MLITDLEPSFGAGNDTSSTPASDMSPRAARDESEMRRPELEQTERWKCRWCRSALEDTDPRRLYCSRKCRQAACRLRRQVQVVTLNARPMRFAYADPPYPGRAKKILLGPTFVCWRSGSCGAHCVAGVLRLRWLGAVHRSRRFAGHPATVPATRACLPMGEAGKRTESHKGPP